MRRQVNQSGLNEPSERASTFDPSRPTTGSQARAAPNNVQTERPHPPSPFLPLPFLPLPFLPLPSPCVQIVLENNGGRGRVHPPLIVAPGLPHTSLAKGADRYFRAEAFILPHDIYVRHDVS